MSHLPCRILLVDHASRLPLWEAAEFSSAATLTRVDPRPLAPWDVSALSVVFEVGAPHRSLLDLLGMLPRLSECKLRVSFARDQTPLVLVEKRDHAPLDMPAMIRDIEALAQAAPPVDACTLLAEPILPYPEPTHRLGVRLSRNAGRLLPPGVRTIVVVEDHVQVRSLCLRILQPQFLVFEVNGSLDALALAERLPIPLHLLISDIRLPNMDGVTLARCWRSRQPESSVLLLSGYPFEPDDADEIVFLPKPFQAAELVRLAQQLTTRAEHAPAQAC